MDYSEFFKKRNITNYEIDGILNDAKWTASKAKILFILKETAGYQDRFFYMKDEIPKWISDNVPTIVNIAKLALLLEKTISENITFETDALQRLVFNKDELLDYITRASVININKESVRHKSLDTLVYNKYLENVDLLKQQIHEIEPRIVIGASRVSWNCISYTSNGLFKDYGLKGIKKHSGVKIKDKVFYYANHPSAWTSGGFNPVKIYKQIIELL